ATLAALDRCSNRAHPPSPFLLSYYCRRPPFPLLPATVASHHIPISSVAVVDTPVASSHRPSLSFLIFSMQVVATSATSPHHCSTFFPPCSYRRPTSPQSQPPLGASHADATASSLSRYRSPRRTVVALTFLLRFLVEPCCRSLRRTPVASFSSLCCSHLCRSSRPNKTQHGESFKGSRSKKYDHGQDTRYTCMRIEFSRWEDGDLIGWISRSEKFFHFHKTLVESMVEMASTQLESDVIQWYDLYKTYHGVPLLGQFKRELLSCFGPLEYKNINGQLTKNSSDFYSTGVPEQI
ncbi:hypothetical protein GW17_00061110, partial [Ensete ventricosum]